MNGQPVPTKNRVTGETGTYVSVILTLDEDLENLTQEFVIEVLRQQYNAILSNYYKVEDVTVNGKTVKPWIIPINEIENRKSIDFRCGKYPVKGFIVKSTKSLPEEYQGPFIVVHGKTVNQEWFRQYPIRSDTFYGLILADYLIEVLRTSKSDFDRKSLFWKKFNGKMALALAKWFDDIGAKPKSNVNPESLNEMSKRIEKSINQVLKLPEFEVIAKTLFQNRVQKEVAVKSEQGTLMGSDTDGMQITTGTLGGNGNTEGTSTEGEDEGIGVVENDDGDVPIEKVNRKVRSLVKIGFEEKPKDILEGWIDPAQKAIIVNTGHPSWKIAEGLSVQAKVEHVISYHILRTVFSTLVDEMADVTPKEVLTKLFSSWYDSCVRDY